MATATPARTLVTRAVIWAGLAIGTCLMVLAVRHGIRVPRLEVVLSVLATWALLTVLSVVAVELLRRHHRALRRHGKRGAVAAARRTRTGARSATAWLAAKAAPRWENREPRPLMFRKLRGDPEDPAAEPAPEAEAPAPGAPPPDDAHGGTTSMTVSRIAPERRARRTAARTGGTIPAAWGPVITLAADFEPEDDAALLDWMNGQVTGMSGYGEALVDLYDHCTSVIGIDPAASALLHDVADAVAHADPSVKGTVYHPLTTPWPSAEPSPYAGWFPAEATIRDPVPVGIIPETGDPMTLTLFDEIGAKAIGVHGATGSGKSTLLNGVRERVTAMTDAALVQLNGAHMGDELTWEPLAAATACGPAASDEDVRDKILAVLGWAQQLVTDRSATLAQTGHSVFQPTPDDPAYVLMVDEVDEVVASVPGSGAILEFLASKQRKSAVCLILATQRATQKQTGGGMVRANLSQVVIGNTNRATESRHATGAEADIPDISEYSRGRKGYFQIWDPQAKEITARGRTFLLGVPPDELAYCKRIVDARRGARRVLPGPDLVPDAPRGHGPQGRAPGEHAPGAAAPCVSEMRARLAAARERAEAAPGSAPVRHRAVPGVPPEAMAVLMRLLAAPGGTTASAAGLALGKSKSSALDYLAALRDRGIAEKTGGGRGSRFRLVRAQPPAAPESRPHTTLEALAQAVHDGLVDASDEQRVVLEQVWQIANRPRLTILQGSGGDGS
jgi:hypothetical protein